MSFAAAMAALGPFERHPHVAVAVSGGADSLALAMMADQWARGQGGKVTALTVDHRLRPESGQEAQQVGAWLAEWKIEHRILSWEGDKPERGIQAAAREARYRILGDWCRGEGVLHLLLAHHLDDQAETFLLRLARGSGVDGLSAMAPLHPLSGLQILRPLLAWPKARLEGFLRVCDQNWIEDPSNRAERFDRVRWRKYLATGGADAARLALTARQMGRARAALEADCAALAAEAVVLHPAGYASIAPEPLRAAPDEIALRLLSALIRCIGGGAFPPRLESLEILRQGLGRRRTIAGCVFAPFGAALVAYREAAKVEGPVDLPVGREILWDRRFSLLLDSGTGLKIAPLGHPIPPPCRVFVEKIGIPAEICPALPAIVDKHGILAVPPLGYQASETGFSLRRWGFAPAFPLIAGGFRLVHQAYGII